MAKTNTIFICQECGHQVPKWLGKCPECDTWNSFAEERKIQPAGSKSRNKSDSPAPFPITHVQTDPEHRLTTGIGEFDRVLGGFSRVFRSWRSWKLGNVARTVTL